MIGTKCTTKNCGRTLGIDDLLFCSECRGLWQSFCRTNKLVNSSIDETTELKLQEALKFFQQRVIV